MVGGIFFFTGGVVGIFFGWRDYFVRWDFFLVGGIFFRLEFFFGRRDFFYMIYFIIKILSKKINTLKEDNNNSLSY